MRADWLDRVFHKTKMFYAKQLTASGHDLGSDALFPQRLGFSGTPNELLPLALLPVRYDMDDESEKLRVLSDESGTVLDVQVLRDWDVIKLLQFVAQGGG